MIPKLSELDDILLYLETTSLEPHDDYKSEFTYREQKLLWNYIKKLTKYKQSWEELKELYYDRNYDFEYGITHSLLENIEIKHKLEKI